MTSVQAAEYNHYGCKTRVGLIRRMRLKPVSRTVSNALLL